MRTYVTLVSKGRLPRLLLCLALAAGLGCGSKKSTVSGEIKYNGKPLKEGTIIFHPKSGGAGVQGQINDGKYSVDKVPPGELLVTIENDSVFESLKTLEQQEKNFQPGGGVAPRKDSPPITEDQKRQADPRPAEEREAMQKRLKALREATKEMPRLPAAYKNKDTSGLSVTAERGKTTDFSTDLKPK